MKGNNIFKQLSKVMFAMVLILAFLCSPITKLVTKVSKVFANNTDSQLSDVEGDNIQVVGFNDKGTVGTPVYLPVVTLNNDAAQYNPGSTGIVYEVKTPAGKSTLVVGEDIKSDSKGYYFVPDKVGVYTVNIYTKHDSKLNTVVENLFINVSKADVTLSVNSSAVVAFGSSANILPAKITLANIADSNFKLDAPTVDGESAGDVVVTCIPAGSTGAGDTNNPVYTMQKKEIKDNSDNVISTYYVFSETDRGAILAKAAEGTYTFKYTFLSSQDSIRLGEAITKTCEVTSNADFVDDIKLEISSLVSGEELTYGEIGTWYSLPTATVVDANSGSSDAVPSVLTIQITPTKDNVGATIEQDGYKFKANKLGTYQITYIASIPYTDLTVEKNFLLELKDETSPEVMFVDTYNKSEIMTAHEITTEEKFVEYLAENMDASDTIQSVYVLKGGKANINIPAIYAKDNSTDGNYTLTRKVTYNNQDTNFNDNLNTATTHEVTGEGVYTIYFQATDSNGETSIAKRTVVVVSEQTLLDCASTIQGTTVTDLQNVNKPTIKTGTVSRTLQSDGTLTFALPTATDAIANTLKSKSGFTKLSTATDWSSYVDITATIVGYNTNNEPVDGASYTFTADDITDDNKYTLDMTDSKFAALKAEGVAYFVIEYSAATDWMTAISNSDTDTTNDITSSTAKSAKIAYVDVNDTTAATIAVAEGTDLLIALEDANIEQINGVLAKYNKTTQDVNIGDNGMITIAGDPEITIAPFNQYSAENQKAVQLPKMSIVDSEDATNLSVTASITDSLGNTKTIVPTFDSILPVVSGGDTVYQYTVSLGEVQLTNAGQYTVTIQAVDKGGNISVYSYAIMVNDTTAPSDVILDADITGESTISTTYYTGEFIYFPEAKIIDNADEDCTYTASLVSWPKDARITENTPYIGFETLTAGTYEIEYICTDGAGLSMTKRYTLEVKAKDHTKVVVDEDVFNPNFRYEFTGATANGTMEIVIPYGLAINEKDPLINNKEITPVVKNKNNVTQTVTAKDGNFVFNATQGKYTVEYKQGTVSKSYTIYVGDTDAPTLTWKSTVPSTLTVGDEWGKGIADMFEIYDINNGAKTKITEYTISIVTPEDETEVYTGNSDYKFDQEGTYKIKITFEDGINEVTETKSIEVKSTETEAKTNTTNVVGTILLVASILVVGGVVVYLILSSRKKGKKSDKKND